MADSSPANFDQPSHLAVVGLGGNIGPVMDNLNGAIAKLSLVPGVKVHRCSNWYQSRPVGPPQPDYINGCATLAVSLSPQELLQTLLGIEQKFGRIRGEKWGPRTLDLDLIFYGDRQVDQDGLEIPHPHMQCRPFVLVPLAEIAPELVDPRSGKTIGELVKKVDCTTVWQVATMQGFKSHQTMLKPPKVAVV